MSLNLIADADHKHDSSSGRILGRFRGKYNKRTSVAFLKLKCYFPCMFSCIVVFPLIMNPAVTPDEKAVMMLVSHLLIYQTKPLGIDDFLEEHRQSKD